MKPIGEIGEATIFGIRDLQGTAPFAIQTVRYEWSGDPKAPWQINGTAILYAGGDPDALRVTCFPWPLLRISEIDYNWDTAYYVRADAHHPIMRACWNVRRWLLPLLKRA